MTRCPGWSESSLGAHVILLILPHSSSNRCDKDTCTYHPIYPMSPHSSQTSTSKASLDIINLSSNNILKEKCFKCKQHRSWSDTKEIDHLLCVNCRVISHCLEVSCKVDYITSVKHDWYIYLQLTDEPWFITLTTIHALELIYFNSNIMMKNQLHPSDSSNFCQCTEESHKYFWL